MTARRLERLVMAALWRHAPQPLRAGQVAFHASDHSVTDLNPNVVATALRRLEARGLVSVSKRGRLSTYQVVEEVTP